MKIPESSPRTFLFLQGLATPFFGELGKKLMSHGHHVLKINLCPGDRLFWREKNSTNYRGRFDEWPRYLSEFLEIKKVTDVLLFGDCRPYHRLAVKEAKRRKITIHVFEEGYLRPSWITIDQGGTNANSSLPRTAEKYLALARTMKSPQPREPIPAATFQRAIWDMANHTANICLKPLHPYYLPHRAFHPLAELRGWSRRIVRRHFRGERKAHERKLQNFLRNKPKFFFFPLQLDSDSQITEHSPFRDLGHAMETVISSFATHAPEKCRLLIKCHPLDNDLTPREPQVSSLTDRYGISDRVTFIDGGHLPTIFRHTEGVVTINSTVGTSAMQGHLPVKALGQAIYNFSGLADQQPLDTFWSKPQRPSQKVLHAYIKVLRNTCLVHGSFYQKEGIREGVEAATKLLLDTTRRQNSADLPNSAI